MSDKPQNGIYDFNVYNKYAFLFPSINGISDQLYSLWMLSLKNKHIAFEMLLIVVLLI